MLIRPVGASEGAALGRVFAAASFTGRPQALPVPPLHTHPGPDQPAWPDEERGLS